MAISVSKLRNFHGKDIMEANGSRMARRVVLLCAGSFNPPTLLHLRAFEVLRDHLQSVGLESHGAEIIGGYMSPVSDAYGKVGLVSSIHRVAMTRLATATSSWIDVDSWEAEQMHYSRTLEVLNRFDSFFNNGLSESERIRVMLLCGSDLLASFATPGVWIPDEISQIISSRFGIACLDREGVSSKDIIESNPLLSLHRNHIFVAGNYIMNDVSSSKVRYLLQNRKSVRYLIPDSVCDYIVSHNLYTGSI